MHADEQRARSQTDPSRACYIAGTAQYDAGTVDYDAGTVEYHQGSLQYDEMSPQDHMKQVGDDFAKLQSAEAAVPSYLPTGLPTQNDVNAAVSATQSAISKANSQMNADVSQAKSVAANAKSETDALAKQLCGADERKVVRVLLSLIGRYEGSPGNGAPVRKASMASGRSI